MKDNTSFQFELPKHQQSIIKVIGVGGGGSNAVEHMYEQGIKDVEFIICNTDRQAIQNSSVPTKIQIGLGITEGLGAGADPEVGRSAALENKEEIREILSMSTKMLFITAGMGGGTGTGAAPVIAQIAKDLGILTVGIVTAPFKWEGRKKMRYADNGVEELKSICDTVLVIMNDKLKDVYPTFGINEAFSKADDVLTTAAKSIAEIVTKNIKVNVDFNDVYKVMKNAGTAVMGSAIVEYQEGINNALKAGEDAIVSPLLNNADIAGAERILLTVTHGPNAFVSIQEFEELCDYIVELVGTEVEEEVIFGIGLDSELDNQVKVTIVATGFQDKEYEQKPQYVNLNADKSTTQISSKPANYNFDIKNSENQSPFEISKNQQPNLFDVSNKDDERTISFDIREEKSFENKNKTENTIKSNEEIQRQKLASERKEKLQGMSYNISSNLTDKEIDEKLNVPAYKRKNIDISEESHSSESEISRFTLNDDDEMLGNNRFLHDNVD